jgi:hypothetical protein
MTDIRHYWKGQIVNPRDFKIKVSMDWLNRKSAPSIDVESLQFYGQTGADMRARYLSGLNGGVGVFEGDPYQIQIGENSTNVFDGYIDFSKGVRFIGCSEIEVSLKKKQGVDWLADVADGFSYRYLESIGVVKQSDFFGIPYVINYVPDGVQLLLLAISTFSLVKELIENIKSLSDRISDLSDAATPVVGVSAGLGAGVVTAYDIGNIIMAALKLIAQVAYLVAIVYAIIKLVEQIMEQLMPLKRFHLGMGIRTLVQRGCDHLNLNLSSTLLDNLDKGAKWVIIPEKGHKGGERPTGADNSWRETGVPNQNDPFDTFGKVIRQLKSWFNADYKIENGTFYLERKDQFRTNSPWVIPNTFTNQDTLQDENTFNADEIRANYNINYSTDAQDQNTLDNQEGRIFQAQLQPKVTVDAKLRNLQGLEEVQIPCSLGTRKDELTFLESALKVFADFVDSITGQLGNPQSFGGQINSRIGTLHLSSHFTSVPKVVAFQGSSLAKNQRTILGAKALWDNYHFINSFAPINGKHNQYWKYEEQPMAFCMEDFVSLASNNLVVTPTGENAEIERLDWETWDNKATVSYRVNRQYDNNFNIVYL